jgi:lysophospholipase L1-like esterase
MHEQSRRVKLLAEEESDLSFVDAGDVISPTNLDYFEEDQVHPSELGAEVIGEYIAQFLPEPE